MSHKREAPLDRPESVKRFDEIAKNLRQSWEDGLFGSSFKHWEEVTAESKVGHLAECAPYHGISFDRFVEGVRIGLNVPDGYRFSGDDQWHLHRQFREGQQAFEIEQTPRRPAVSQQALFAEWRADDAAAKARDQGGANSPSVSSGKSELEAILYGGKSPEFKHEQESKEKGRER
jgi:hypothetical protein